MMPNAFITHDMRGRARIRIPSARGNAAYFERLDRQLAGVAGIDSLQANPVTGSILVLHREGLTGLLEQAARQNLFVIAPEKPGLLTSRVADRLSRADSSVQRATDGRMDLVGTVALGLTGVGALQMLRGSVLPPAVTLFWYAFGLAYLARNRDK